MVSVCFYFQVHQPFRLRNYSVFDIGAHKNYFDDEKNIEIIKKVAKKCYLPANKAIFDLIQATDGKFKASYSITGTALEQFEKYYPEVIDSFKALVKTNSIEILDETYYHSLAGLYSDEEFKNQINMHTKKVKKLFNYTPKIFRNTELIYNNHLARVVEDQGYKGMLLEGADHVLRGKSSNFLYKSLLGNMKLLLRNYTLSDDMSFRFSEKNWKEYPLTAPKFSKWVSDINGNGNVINLFMDYETFGEHQWEHTGIFNFVRHLPHEIMKHPDNEFITPSEAVEKYPAVDTLDVHNPMSWADTERDISAWHGNAMQKDALNKIYEIKDKVYATNDPVVLDLWRKLQTSDHFYYMCTKWFNDGDVHKYFNPYDSPYEGFIAFMNILNDLKEKVNKLNIPNPKPMENKVFHGP